MSQPGGQAAGYYNNAPPQQGYGYGAPPPQQNYGYNQGPPPQNYGGPQHAGFQQSTEYQQMPPPQQSFEYQDPNKYTQAAPTYAPPQDSKQGFDQTFKIQKPKFNDWWAGLLFIATFLGFVVCSRITKLRGCTNYSRLYPVFLSIDIRATISSMEEVSMAALTTSRWIRTRSFCLSSFWA